jgi:hypothetical protein
MTTLFERAKERFTAHPVSVGETYCEHMKAALGIAAGGARIMWTAAVNNVCSRLYKGAATQKIEELYAFVTQRTPKPTSSDGQITHPPDPLPTDLSNSPGGIIWGGGRIMKAAAIHAFFPWRHTTTASRTIKELHQLISRPPDARIMSQLAGSSSPIIALGS